MRVHYEQNFATLMGHGVSDLNVAAQGLLFHLQRQRSQGFRSKFLNTFPKLQIPISECFWPQVNFEVSKCFRINVVYQFD